LEEFSKKMADWDDSWSPTVSAFLFKSDFLPQKRVSVTITSSDWEFRPSKGEGSPILPEFALFLPPHFSKKFKAEGG
jgi:hypothetical protein